MTGDDGSTESTWITPPAASAPYRSLAPPRTTSTLSMATCGTRSQLTQPPKGSLSGTPSASTRVRLAPEADSPRNVTPCVVGFAMRDGVRRKSEKPGVSRNTSSSVPAAATSRSRRESTVASAGRSAPRTGRRPAVTVTCSVRAAGSSWTSKAAEPGWSASTNSANPGADTRKRSGSGTSGTGTIAMPSAPVITARPRPRESASTTALAPAIGSPSVSDTRTRRSAAGGWASPTDARAERAETRRARTSRLPEINGIPDCGLRAHAMRRVSQLRRKRRLMSPGRATESAARLNDAARSGTPSRLVRSAPKTAPA